MFDSVLVANRGEIAVRIIRTLRELGLRTCAVYSEADRSAPHVRMADAAVCIGPPQVSESYLRMDKILDAAKTMGAQAIHPGYGFLSENARFAQAVRDAGLTFIGPTAQAIDAMGDKVRARKAMQKAGVPVVPGTFEALSEEEVGKRAAEMGFPVMLKAAAGGGGKGMRQVERASDLVSALRGARAEAKAAFGDDTVYLEKRVHSPRHVEIQVFGDRHGKVVHLYERDCSVQRRHQKIIEETPSTSIDQNTREAMGAAAVRAAAAVDYEGAGTIEFLVDGDGRFYFLEMNTRLQVEHPITEWVTGLDLVALQVAVARGEPLPFAQADVKPRGHAIEARVYAEDPRRGFMPAPGKIAQLRLPAGPFVRVDEGVASGSEVTVYYDPMIAKLSVWGASRREAIARLDRALRGFVVNGIVTNIQFLREVLHHEGFVRGGYDTGICEQVLAAERGPASEESERVALIAAAIATYDRDRARAQQPDAAQDDRGSAWRQAGRMNALRRWS